jgi:uncharacterized protein
MSAQASNNMKALPIVVIAIVSLVGLGFLFNSDVQAPDTSSTTTVEIPTPTGYVNDLSDVLSPDVEASMESYLKTFAESGKGEVAVLTLPTTQPFDIEQFGIELGDEWKVGDSEEDNGVILIVATEDRQVRIEVGSGAEAYITDSKAGQILDNEVVPEFKNGNWAEGINGGVIAIVNEMSSE